LEAEMLELTERRRIGCDHCLQLLSQDGPYRLEFSELLEVYELTQNLREANDAMAGELAGLQWRRFGTSSAESPSRLVVSESHLPPGPVFKTPMELLQSKPVVEAEEWKASHMPKAVVSKENEFANVWDLPRSPEDQGLGFLLDSGKRLKPRTAPMSLATAAWGGFGFSKSDNSWLGESREPLDKESMARKVKDAFKEPLSAALGTAPRQRPAPTAPLVTPGHMHPPAPSARSTECRTGWVTFQPRAPVASAPCSFSSFPAQEGASLGPGDVWPDDTGVWADPSDSGQSAGRGPGWWADDVQLFPGGSGVRFEDNFSSAPA